MIKHYTFKDSRTAHLFAAKHEDEQVTIEHPGFRLWVVAVGDGQQLTVGKTVYSELLGGMVPCNLVTPAGIMFAWHEEIGCFFNNASQTCLYLEDEPLDIDGDSVWEEVPFGA